MKQTSHQYKARFLLIGFNSTVKKIQLSENIVIRKGNSSELKEMYERIKLRNVESQQFFVEFEYVSSSKNTIFNESYDLMNELNSFFQIFTNGKVKIAHFIRYIYLEDKYQACGFSTNNKVFAYFEEEFKLTLKRSKELIEYWKLFLQQKDKKALQIGIRRLLFSTQKHELEDKLIDLMIAFEATYLDASEKGEIAYKLALRTSYFLRNHFDKKQVFDFMKKSYGLRSSIVHGANIKGNEISFNNQKLSLKAVVNILTTLMQTTFEILICEHSNSTTKEFIESLDTGIIAAVEK